MGTVQQLVLPTTALPVTVRTLLGDRAVLATGLLSALVVAVAVATEVTPAARTVAGEHRAEDTEAASKG